MDIRVEDSYLEIELPNYSDSLSWCIKGGGRNRVKNILWQKVDTNDLPRWKSPNEFISQKEEKYNKTYDLVFLTSANVKNYFCRTIKKDNLEVTTIATVGMSNALRVGDKAYNSLMLGTINTFVYINRKLSEEALIESMAISIEAKSLACLESDILSKQSFKPATGTGTDCTAITCADAEVPFICFQYSGKHTLLGELIGKTVYEVVNEGIVYWKKNNKNSELIKGNHEKGTHYRWRQLR